jgi:hypothetical protein
MAAMSVFPITKETVQFTLQFQRPEPFRKPFTMKLQWDDLYAHNGPNPEVDLLLQNFVCDHKDKPDTDVLTSLIVEHMLREGRRETVNLWDNLYSVPFIDETSIPGYMLREIQGFNFHTIIIMLEYLFPRHLQMQMWNKMKHSNRVYRSEISKRLNI